PNYDISSEVDRGIVDAISNIDDALIDLGVIKPCRMSAILGKYPVGGTKHYRHWTPEFCTRWPDGWRKRQSVENSVSHQPATSVVVYARHSVQSVLQVLESILMNTDPKLQLVVVDDGSVQGMSETISPLTDVVEVVSAAGETSTFGVWERGVRVTRG